MRRYPSSTFALLIVALHPPFLSPSRPRPSTVESKGGMVVCVSPPAADVGFAILKRGGNAVDAAVAVGLRAWPSPGRRPATSAAAGS